MKKFLLLLSVISAMVFMCFNSYADWVEVDGNWKYQISNGEYETEKIKKSGDNAYYLDSEGNVAKDYLLVDGDNKYYFGIDGNMVINTWVAIAPENLEDDKWGAEVYFMYFGENGKAIRGENGKRKVIDGKTYMFDTDGLMLTGWISENGEHLDSESGDEWYSDEAMYYAREDGSLVEGWLTWTNGLLENDLVNIKNDIIDDNVLYFYFSPSNNKKEKNKEKLINGKKYRFAPDTGRMMTGWEYMENSYNGDNSSRIGYQVANSAGSEYLDANQIFEGEEYPGEQVEYQEEHNITKIGSANKYYDKEEGSLVKKGWIYDIPSSVLSSNKYDDEEKEWFYANNDGGLVVDQEKKINGKTYLFDKNGIMQKSLIIKCKANYNTERGDGNARYNTDYYIERVDLEKTTGIDFIKTATYYAKDDHLGINTNIVSISNVDMSDPFGRKFYEGHENDDKYYRQDCIGSSTKKYNIFYFGDDGAKKTGENIQVEFSDGVYTFASKKDGAYYGFHKKKYYSNGFLCKANENVGLGLVLDYDQLREGDDGDVTKVRNLNSSIVVNYGLGGMYAFLSEIVGDDIEMMIATLESVGLAKYNLYYPFITVIARVATGSDDNRKFNSLLYVVDKNGKLKKKGSYKDKDGNWWLVDDDKQFLGIFSKEVKWKKVDGKEVPCYKSDFTHTNSKGEIVEKEEFQPFWTVDAHGKTEMDYVVELTDECLTNFVNGPAGREVIEF